jgi:hypothetical protein
MRRPQANAWAKRKDVTRLSEARLSRKDVPPALKRVFLKDPFHGPKGPFFHRFFALKREEK